MTQQPGGQPPSNPQHNPHHPHSQPSQQSQHSGGEWQPTAPPAPPAPQSPGKEKSWFARHKILTVVLAVLGLIVLSSLLSGGEEGTQQATPTETTAAAAPAAENAADDETAAEETAAGETAVEEPAEEPVTEAAGEPAAQVAGIGDPVRDGKFEFVVTGVEDGGTEIGSDFCSEKAQGRFQLVHISVTNIGDQAQTMFDSNQKVKDEQGRTFAPNSSAAIYMDDNDLWLTDINPGNTMSGTLVFDMPEGATPVEIELHDSMFSGGVTVSLR